MSHFKVRENEIVGGGIGCQIQSLLFISYLKTPENVIVGAGVSYLCKITTSRAPAASQITFSSSVVFLFPPQNSRKCRYGVLVVSSIEFMHMFNISCTCDNLLCMFSVFIFHVPLQGSGKRNCGWWCQGCEIQSLQIYPSHFLPQNSGKCNCRGWGVIFVQIETFSCACGKSNYIFFLCRFLFPHLKARENYRYYRCGVLVVCSVHAHVQHLMHLRQSDLHVFSFYFPCPTSRFGKMKLWVVVSRLSNSISSVLPFSLPTSKLRKM